LVTVEAVSDPGNRVNVRRELNALEEGLATGYVAHLGNKGLTKREQDIAVLVGVLKDRIAPIGVEIPAGRRNHFGVAVERGVGGDKVEDWWIAGFLD